MERKLSSVLTELMSGKHTSNYLSGFSFDEINLLMDDVEANISVVNEPKTVAAAETSRAENCSVDYRISLYHELVYFLGRAVLLDCKYGRMKVLEMLSDNEKQPIVMKYDEFKFDRWQKLLNAV